MDIKRQERTSITYFRLTATKNILFSNSHSSSNFISILFLIPKGLHRLSTLTSSSTLLTFNAPTNLILGYLNIKSIFNKKLLCHPVIFNPQFSSCSGTPSPLISTKQHTSFPCATCCLFLCMLRLVILICNL